MKILIVDDEIFVRMGIKTTYDWSKYGFEIIGEAEDGIEAMDIFMKHKPDIVLVDIKMPRMNGIDFIAKVKDINPYCRFIVLSCYNEFEYVREAMKLGVRDYIIKTTMKRNELIEVIKKVAGEIKAEKEKLNVLNAEKRENYVNKPIVIKKFLNDVIEKIETNESSISRKISDFQLEIDVPNLFIILISLDNYKELKQKYDPKDYDLITFGVANISQEILRQYTKGYVFKRSSNELVCFVTFDRDTNVIQEKEILSFIAADIMKSVKEFLNIDISLGISGSIDSFSQIGEGYSNALSALRRKFFTGPNSINFFDVETNNDFLLINKLKSLESKVQV
jgi:two-component system response regulator YesN